MRLPGNRYVGSNPTVSATDACKHCVCRLFYFLENADFSFFSFHEKRARQVILEPSPLQTPSLLAFRAWTFRIRNTGISLQKYNLRKTFRVSCFSRALVFISFPGTREVCVRQCQSSLHSHGRRYLCREVKMCVYVGRSAEITVAQPFLHTLKRYSARYQQACTTVPEIVKTILKTQGKAAAAKRKALGSRKHAQKSAARGNKRMEQTIKKLLKNLFYKEITGRNPEDWNGN